MPQGSVTKSLPPPVGGWDTQNALADMPIQNAVILDNWFPSTDKITLRKGNTVHATGMSGRVESLLMYTPQTGSGRMIAANGGALYDISTSGAVGTAIASGFTNDRWQHTQIGTPGGHFMLAVNGQDAAQIYNGSTFSAASITGPTPANLVWCNIHQRRLWFGEKDSLTAWYLPVNSIAGTASQFSFAGLAGLGGYIMAMGTWSRDGGDGSDDVAVFLTSEGNAIVYQGSDPSSATTWGLVGVFRIGKPIGRRCVLKAGADLIMVTQDGFVPASQILIADRAQAEAVAISAQINKAVNDSVQNGATLFGWQPIIYPKGQMLIFNVPQSGTMSHQYVFNTLTKAPCRFTGMNALCWGLLNDVPYFGAADGKVYRFDNGTADNSAAILGDALQAFTDFGIENNKSFKLVEPLFQANGNPNVALDLNVDYQIRAPSGVAAAAPITAAKWGVSHWGVGKWGSAQQIYRGWRGVRGLGKAASLRVRVSTTTVRPSWVATNFLFLPGGTI